MIGNALVIRLHYSSHTKHQTMKQLLVLPLVLLMALTPGNIFAQNPAQVAIDSMLLLVPKAKEDTNKVKILGTLSIKYTNLNPEEGIKYGEQCMQLATKLGWRKGVARAYDCIGSNYQAMGDQTKALDYFGLALKICDSLSDKGKMADMENSMGSSYEYKGEYAEAMKHYFNCLKLYESIGDKQGIGKSYNGIGNIYDFQDNSTEALKNYGKSLKIAEETNDKGSQASAYNNMGLVYERMCAETHRTEYCDTSLINLFKALKIKQELGKQASIGNTLNCIGNAYYHKQNYDEALKNRFAALKIFEAVKAKGKMAMCYNNIGQTYMRQKKYAEAEKYLKIGVKLCEETQALQQLEVGYSKLHDVYEQTGRYKEALKYMELYMNIKDSLSDKANSKKIMQVQMEYDYDKKAAVAALKQEKKDAMVMADMKKQKMLTNTFIGGFALVVGFSTIVYRQRNKVTKERNLVTKEKKRSDELLLNILPSEVAEELKNTGGAAAKLFDDVTIIFTDFVDFTSAGERMSPHELVDELDTCFKAFDRITSKYNIEKIKTIGDAYLAVAGLPTTDPKHAENVVRASLEILQFMLERKKQIGDRTFEIRIGVHSGSVVAGIVGVKKFAYDIWGDTVNTAARMEQNSEPGKVNISQTTYELVKDKFTCEYRGAVEAKNKGLLKMYFVG